MLNSIGLPNRGLAGHLEHDLPALAELPVPLIVNVMGFAVDQVATLVRAFAEREEVSRAGAQRLVPERRDGHDHGRRSARDGGAACARPPADRQAADRQADPERLRRAAVARAAQEAGADAVSLINTIRGMALHPATGEPALGGITGGVSGRRRPRRRARPGPFGPCGERDSDRRNGRRRSAAATPSI